MSNSWIDEIQTDKIKSSLTVAITDNKISFTEMLNILTDSANSGLSTVEFQDLQKIYVADVFESEYLKYLMHSSLTDNPSNYYFWGGATSVNNVTSLNTEAPLSENDANKLIGKWFLGTDLPMPISGGDTATGQAADGIYAYNTSSGSLFVDGISYTDVNQGYAGTCYAIAAFLAAARTNPSIIENMFIENPNGTYGVKFYFDGEPVYTTINNELPVTYSGSQQIVFAGNSSKNLNGETWVTQLEKAYAQVNSQVNLKDQSNWNDSPTLRNSYQFMEGGLAYPLKQMTNLSFDYFTCKNWYFGESNSHKYSSNFSDLKSDVIKALNDGGIGWIAFWGNSYNADGKQEAVGGHAFALQSYDSATDTFLIENPWGGPGSYYHSSFNVKLEDLWEQCTPAIAITSPAAAKSFTYTISSDADTAISAVNEGENVTVTITRSDIGGSSSVYLTTNHKTTAAGDFKELSMQKIGFADNELIKTVTIPIYSDGLSESIESFELKVFNKLQDTTPFSTSELFIKNIDQSNLTYTITTNADSNGLISEGSDLEVTITRDSSGSKSTVYLSTVDGGTNSNDFEHLVLKPIVFSEKQTSVTVNIETYSDNQTESGEEFKINLYDGMASTSPLSTKSIYLQDNWTPDYNYLLFSSAPNESSAISEGDDITFTVMRSGSGTQTKVYLKSYFDTALSNDLENSGDIEITFNPSETLKTFTVKTSEDLWLETTESFGYELYTSPTATSPETKASAFIKDKLFSDFEYSIQVNNGEMVKEGDTVPITITRSGQGEESSVFLSTTLSSASSSDLSTLNKKEIKFNSFETKKTVNIDIFSDSVSEGDEIFYLDLFLNESDTTYAYYKTVTINDVSSSESYSYTINDVTTNEGETAEFTVTRSSSGSASTVFISTSHWDTDKNDFKELELQSITFSAKETSKVIKIDTYADSETESSENFWLDLYLTKADGYDNNYHSYGTATIKDASSGTNYAYTVSSDQTTYSEGEKISFTITRDNSGSESIIYIATSDGTATSDDYEAKSLTAINFSEKETKKVIEFDTYTDTKTEGDEYFYLDLYTNPSDFDSGNYYDYDWVYISDSASGTTKYTYTVNENTTSEGQTATFTITRDGTDEASSIFVNTSEYDATSGVDFETLSGKQVDFAIGEATKTVDVKIYSDSSNEATEYYYLDVYKTYADAKEGNDWIAWNWGTITDTSSTTKSYNYTVGDISAKEGTTATFTITRDGSDQASTIYINTSEYNASAGDDFESIIGKQVDFSVGETSKTVDVKLESDNKTEGIEYYYFDIYATYADAVEGYDYLTYSWGTIEDVVEQSQGYKYSVNAVTAKEGSTATFTITRDGSGQASSVFVNTSAYDASLGTDFQHLKSVQVDFGASETEKNVDVEIFADSNSSEGTEYFYIDLYATAQSAAAAGSDYIGWNWGTIEDVAQKTYSYTASASTAYEGSTATFTITRDGSDQASSVYVNTSAYDASLGSDFQHLKGLKLDFGIGETEKSVNVEVYADTENEGTEYFYIDLYATAESAAAAGSDYIGWNWGTIKEQGGLQSKISLSATNYSSTQNQSVINTYYGQDGKQFSNANAFAILNDDGTVHTWGSSENGGDTSSLKSDLVNVSSIHSSEKAFAVIKTDGSVIAWGNQNTGGNLGDASTKLNGTINATSIASTKSAFAAIRSDGSVVTWGSSGSGGDNQNLETNNNIQSIYSNMNAFAAITNTGDVITWGQSAYGGDSSSVNFGSSTQVNCIYSTSTAFAALQADGSVVAWGNKNDGGDISTVASNLDGRVNVTDISSTTNAFAALMQDGSVVTWGNFANGGLSTSVSSSLDGTIKVQKVIATNGAFAALREDGSVVSWGNSFLGGDSSSVANNLNGTNKVTDIYSNGYSFVATHADNTITTWGFSAYGGNSNSVKAKFDGSNTIKDLVSSETAHALLFEDGTFVTWGSFSGDQNSRIDALVSGNSNIQSLSSNANAFYAKTADNSILSWGDQGLGGNYVAPITSSKLTINIASRSNYNLDNVNSKVDFQSSEESKQSSSDGNLSFDISSSSSFTLSNSLDYSNTSKSINTQDALDALRLSVGLSTTSGTQDAFSYIAADINKDGKVTAEDALLILKYSLGLEVDNKAQWVFVDKNSDFSSINKNNVTYQENISFTNFSSDTTLSVTGILLGDTSDSYTGIIA